MTVYKEFKVGNNPNNPLGSFTGVVILILFFVLLYFVAKGLFTVLSFIAPVLIILALILDYSVVIDYGKFVLKLLRNNVLFGILAILLTVVGFPVVSGFLFFRALLRRKIGKIMNEAQKRERPEFADYEVIEEDTEDFLELPDFEDPKPKAQERNDYDDFFK